MRGRASMSLLALLLLLGASAPTRAGGPEETIDGITCSGSRGLPWTLSCVSTGEGEARCDSVACVAVSVKGDARCDGAACVALAPQGDSATCEAEACVASAAGPAQCASSAVCVASGSGASLVCAVPHACLMHGMPGDCGADVCSGIADAGDVGCATSGTGCAAATLDGGARCTSRSVCTLVGDGRVDCSFTFACIGAALDGPSTCAYAGVCTLASVRGDAGCGASTPYPGNDVSSCAVASVEGDARCARAFDCVAASVAGDATCGTGTAGVGPAECVAISGQGDARCHRGGAARTCAALSVGGDARCEEDYCLAVSALGDANATCLVVGLDGACVVDPEVEPFGTPPAVTGLVATAGVGEVFLRWDVPPSQHRHRVASYEVQRSLSGGAWQAIASVTLVEEARTDAAYLDKGVPSGAEARYRVAARSLDGLAGAASAIVSAHWRASHLPPPVLDGAATGTGPFVGQAIVAWSAPRDAGGTPVPGVVRYDIYRSGGSEDGTSATYDTISAPLGHDVAPRTEPRHRVASIAAQGDVPYSWVDTAPPPPQSQYYVVAVDASGGFSRYSEEGSALWTPTSFGAVPLLDVDSYGPPRGSVDLCGDPIHAVLTTARDPLACEHHVNLQVYADLAGPAQVHAEPFVDVLVAPGRPMYGFRTSSLDEPIVLGSAQECATFGYEVGAGPFPSLMNCF